MEKARTDYLWDHRITQAGSDLRRSLVQRPAQSRVSYRVRPGSSGLYLVGLTCSAFWRVLGFFCSGVQCCSLLETHCWAEQILSDASNSPTYFRYTGQWKWQNLASLEHVLLLSPSSCNLELEQKEQSVQNTLNLTFSFHFPGSIFHSYWSRFVPFCWSPFTWRAQLGYSLASKWIGKCCCLFYLTSFVICWVLKSSKINWILYWKKLFSKPLLFKLYKLVPKLAVRYTNSSSIRNTEMLNRAGAWKYKSGKRGVR